MKTYHIAAMKPLASGTRCLRTLILPLLGVLTAGCASSGGVASGCDPRLAASPQYSRTECKFLNPPNPDSRAAVLKAPPWRRFLFEKKPVGSRPLDAIPLRPVSPASLKALNPHENHVIRLGHSSHLLKLQNKYWLIDPVFSERVSPVQWAGPTRFHPSPLALADVPLIDGLILSHDHYDHLDRLTIETLLGKVQRYFVPVGVGARLRAFGVAADRIEELDWWQETSFNSIRLAATPASHFSGRTLWDRDKSSLWASWVIESGPHKLFYSGDTGYFPGFKQIGEKYGPFDLAMMENGAYDDAWPEVHMSPEESALAFKDVKGKLLYVIHNSTFDLAYHTWQEPLVRINELANRQGLTIATPEIGEVLTIGKPRENKRWWEGLK